VFTLDEFVPWGRSFDEYRRMSALSDADLCGRLLGCADGPASFNAEATRRGARVLSCDPLYQWTPHHIEARLEATYSRVLSETQKNTDGFVWTTVHAVEELGRVRMAAMRTFLSGVAMERVPYEFQRGGNEMLRVRRITSEQVRSFGSSPRA
jgi:hypothetical protein